MIFRMTLFCHYNTQVFFQKQIEDGQMCEFYENPNWVLLLAYACHHYLSSFLSFSSTLSCAPFTFIILTLM